MKSFARVTKLSNIGGRADYITNEKKQEAILAKSEAVDWKPYRDFERANQRTATANNEGREMIIALPNEWAKLPPAELHARANTIAQTAVGKATDLQWAVHWNHARSNLHIHVIFSERQREKDAGRWDRDIYLTADGKVARRRADRAKNPDGTDKPPVHRKGEEKGGFTAKDKTYTTKGWLADTKERLKQTFIERWGVNIEKPDYLHQYHEGKGREAPAIRQKNEVIKSVNGRLKDLASVGFSVEKNALPPIRANMKNRFLIVPYLKDGQPQLRRCRTAGEAVDFLHQTKADWSARFDTFRQQPSFSFTAVLEAQRGYYEALFAMKDQRKPLDLINLVQFIKDNVIPCLLPLNDGQYTIAPLIFWVSFPLKAPLWEHLSVKLSWCNCLIELPQPLIFHLEQLLISRFSCHKKHPLSALLE